jgi:hypothetical protein
MQVLALIDTPKTRFYESGDSTFAAIAKSVSTLTTEVGWACYKLEANGDVNWANKDGVPTKEFVFTGVEADVIALSYGES